MHTANDMNQTIELSKILEFRNLIKDAYTDLMKRANAVSNAVGKAYINAKLEAWALTLRSIDDITKGETNAMITAKDNLVTQVVRMDEIQQHRRASALKMKIIEDVERLEQLVAEEKANARREKREPKLPGLKMDNTKVNYNHYSGKFSVMKKDREIPDTVRVMKSGQEYYLVPVVK